METRQLAEQFLVEGTIADIREYGSGHINVTYYVEMEQNGTREPYILQQINTNIFANVEQLMENVTNVTSYLRKQIVERGGRSEARDTTGDSYKGREKLLSRYRWQMLSDVLFYFRYYQL